MLNRLSCERIAWIASDPYLATFRTDRVLFFEVVDQALLFLPPRAVLTLLASVRLWHELLNADDGH